MLSGLTIGIKGAGEMASGIAHCLYQANLPHIFMMETQKPLAVRRRVSFCSAIGAGEITVEGVTAVAVETIEDIKGAWKEKKIPVIIDPQWQLIERIQPEVVIDAILAKKNLGTKRGEAPLVIGLGPGFTAGEDVDLLIETERGHNLGRHIFSGAAAKDTGIPGNIGGHTMKRVLRSPGDGCFIAERQIGDSVKAGEIIGTVGRAAVVAEITGVVRGLILSGIFVSAGLKIGDIDPRNDSGYCDTLSDKARTLGGSVIMAILKKFNTKPELSNFPSTGRVPRSGGRP
jgi:xanthine dehydrogenase accessory factor